MGEIVNVPMPGAVELDIVRSEEPWTVVHLEDGASIHVRTVIVSVHRILGQFNPDGTPMYNVGTQLIFKTKAPEGLMRK